MWSPSSLTVPVLFLLMFAATSVAQEGPSRRPGREGRRGGGPADDQAPKVGQAAPLFKIKSLDGDTEFELTSLRGKRPVVLFFGSYT